MRHLSCCLVCGGVIALLSGCLGTEPEGIAPASPASTTVKFDLLHRPLPEIPLPNDVATRYDATSATRRRINASLLAPTQLERRTRALMDTLDGWGLYQPISIPFSGPLDVAAVVKAHRDADYDLSDDVVYLIDIDPASPDYGKPQHLDLGNGNYPVVVENPDKYWKNDPRGFTLSVLFEEADEDLDGDGLLDPDEDTDADGVLDRPNYLPAALLPGKAWPARDDWAGRADALMSFYEAESHTLLLRPVVPLRERTTYAVVVTRRLKDAKGQPVGSPFPYINHVSQNAALDRLPEVLPAGLDLEDVAFAFSFTTQSAETPIVALRDGLYGLGIQAHLGSSFPVDSLELSPTRDASHFPTMKNPYVLYQEQAFEVLKAIAEQFKGGAVGAMSQDLVLKHQSYIDYYAVGSFESPQLFDRVDEDGDPLDLNLQSWPPDLDRVPAPARAEKIHFWLSVPRAEVSARGQGKPAPVVIFGGGYTASRVELIATAGFFARYGLAVLAIDYPSHGISVGDFEAKLATAIAEGYGLGPFVTSMLKGRATDQNADGKPDSGADFFTGYVFHTRDMLRQTVLDYMQLVRILKSFDGQRRWKYGPGGNGLAGDFDGDGKVDLGGDAPIRMLGGSAGGIASLLVGSLEPAIETIAPVSGGAGLLDIGIRSEQPGVPEAFLLRAMCPLYVGTLDAKTGQMKIETIVPNLNKKAELHLATVSGVQVGDTVVVENLASGKRGCGRVDAQGAVRVSVESDLGDRTRLLFYSGNVLAGAPDCALAAGAAPRLTLDRLGEEVEFQGQTFAAGLPLAAFAEGLGYRRATPAFRRFTAFGSVATDVGDPAVYLRFLQREPLVYGTGERTGAHALIVTTVGDMGVPASTGVTAGRVAGIIDYLHPDPRYGVPENQVLIDYHVAEAAHTMDRYENSAGKPVNFDVDNLSQGKDYFGSEVPRLDPPLRVGVGETDRLGGASAALFALCSDEGQHFFDEPGKWTSQLRKDCKASCTKTGGEDPCGCESLTTFDDGMYLLNVIATYLASGGKTIDLDLCNSRDDCPGRPAPPKNRDLSTLP